MFKRFLYVYTVYKEQSFTRAAEKLYISQPSLSAAIKKTEEEIGFPLFERGFSPVRPTQIGLKYIEAAEEILRIEKNFAAYLEDTQDLKQGELSIGGTNYISSFIIPRLVSRFSESYPKINITLLETNSTALEIQVRNETIDLIIDSFEEANTIYESYPLMEEAIMLAVPESLEINHTLRDFQIRPSEIYNRSIEYTAVPALSIQTFGQEKFILLKPGNDMLYRAKRIFKKGQLAPDVAFSLDQLITSFNLTASAAGVSFVTDTLFKFHSYPDNVYLYNIAESEGRTLHIAHKRGKYCSKAMERFIQLAQDTIQ